MLTLQPRRRYNRYARYSRGLYNVGRFLTRPGNVALASVAGKSLYNSYNVYKPKSNVSLPVSTSSYYTSNYQGGRVYKSKRRVRKVKRDIPRNIKNYVKKVVKNDEDKQVCVYRDISSSQLTCEANQCSYTSSQFLTKADIEDAIEDSRGIDPASGVAAEVRIDYTTIDGAKVKLINAKKIILCRNNGQTPCNLEVFWYFNTHRTASTHTPLVAFEDGLENNGITTNELVDLRFNPLYDNQQIKNYYKQIRYKKYRLNGGDEIEVCMNRKKPFWYDPDVFDDSSSSERWPKVSQFVVFRLSGVVSHDDTTTSNVGTCDCTVDFVVNYHIRWNSGPSHVKLKNYIAGTNALAAQAAGPVVQGISIEQMKEEL